MCSAQSSPARARVNLADHNFEEYRMVASTGRVPGLKEIMRLLAESLLPFYGYISREGYDLWDLALDLERLAFLVFGPLELLAGVLGGQGTQSYYALRNVPFYLIACLPVLIPSLRRHRPDIDALILDLEVKPADTLSGLQKLVLLGVRCFGDRRLVVIAMLPLGIDTPRNFGELAFWGAWAKSFEMRYAIGPSTPQHLALGFALSRVTRRCIAWYSPNWQPGRGSTDALPSAETPSSFASRLIIGIPWAFLLAIEAIELAFPSCFNTCAPDLVMDLISGFGGQLLERWSFAYQRSAYDPALA